MDAQLIADVYLYPTEAGGKRLSMYGTFGCPCFLQKDATSLGYDCRILVGEKPFAPGERRRLGFVFPNPEALDIIRSAGKFYLWESRFVGEATVVSVPTSK
jgi:hypothetical protein